MLLDCVLFDVQRKCELYWPEKVGDTFKAGCGIHVQYKEVVPFADFEIKKFIVTNVSPQLTDLWPSVQN